MYEDCFVKEERQTWHLNGWAGWEVWREVRGPKWVAATAGGELKSVTVVAAASVVEGGGGASSETAELVASPVDGLQPD